MGLHDQVALVTGAAHGIGRAVALELAKEGAAVAVNDVVAEEETGIVVRTIEDRGGKAIAVQADVARLDQHALLMESVRRRFGRLDILVNNAGIGCRTAFLDASPEQWDQVLNVNLRGTYFLAQQAATFMIRSGGGRIINISSVHETQPMMNNSMYSISKGGMAMLTKSLALELAQHNILVNSVAPGAISTEATEVYLRDEQYRRQIIEGIPVKRIGCAADVAKAVLYLAESHYITGTTILVDGGMLLR